MHPVDWLILQACSPVDLTYRQWVKPRRSEAELHSRTLSTLQEHCWKTKTKKEPGLEGTDSGGVWKTAHKCHCHSGYSCVNSNSRKEIWEFNQSGDEVLRARMLHDVLQFRSFLLQFRRKIIQRSRIRVKHLHSALMHPSNANYKHSFPVGLTLNESNFAPCVKCPFLFLT